MHSSLTIQTTNQLKLKWYFLVDRGDNKLEVCDYAPAGVDILNMCLAANPQIAKQNFENDKKKSQ